MIIESRLDEVGKARHWLQEHAQAEGFSNREIQSLALVVSEACTNVVRHAYGGEPQHTIELEVAIDAAKLVLTIRDHGGKFDLECYQPPDLDEPHEGGYGVFLIRSLMDEVTYDTSRGQGTTLTLVKYR